MDLANSLIARAADVTLKERRPLILCVRETPFNRIHLRNMTLAAEAGAVIFPCIPAFYNKPHRLDGDGAAVCLPRAGAHWAATAGGVCVEGGRIKHGSGNREQGRTYFELRLISEWVLASVSGSILI